MKNYLVTGCAGFIGSSLADSLLAKGFGVVGLDNINDYYDPKIKMANLNKANTNPNFHFFRGDLTDQSFLKSVFEYSHFDAVIHLAARAGVRPSIADPLEYCRSNYVGTTNLLEFCRKYKVSNAIAASSSSVYGNNKKVPFSEEDPVDYAISPYAATKKGTEVMGYVYHHLYNINTIFLRFFTVYGPRQRPDLAINSFLNCVLQHKTITLYGDGSSRRDYTYIDDIVSGIEEAIQYCENHRDVYEVVNLGSGRPISLIEMVHVIEAVVGEKANIRFASMQPGDVEQTYADISKAQRLFHYSVSCSFEQGVASFYHWLVSTKGGLQQ
jgi:UDP-glucuronate 4-epimerase